MPRYSVHTLCEYAIKYNGQCLAREYRRLDSLYPFKCKEGHDFVITLRALRDIGEDDDWCFQCKQHQHNAAIVRMNAEHKKWNAYVDQVTQEFKQAFPLEVLASSLVTCDDDKQPPSEITDDEYERMAKFMTDHSTSLQRFKSYPAPNLLFERIANDDADKYTKRRVFCIQAMPWILPAMKSMNPSFKLSQWLV